MATGRSLEVVLGVSGGIAAYKAPLVLRLLTEAGHQVRVVPTAAALEMVGAPTFAALSGRPVRTGVFEGATAVDHVDIGRRADLVIVAPATANTLARAAAGMADDLLTATLLTATCPVLLAPAMHTEMWRHPATRDNVAALRRRGTVVLEPAHGRLTGTDTGPGRLPDPEHIGALALAAAERSGVFRQSLAGRRVLITAGGTHEALDPVRFLGNASSGRQGFALADIAVQRGAEVELVAGHTDELPVPSGARITRVSSARDLESAVAELAPEVDAVVMAAAVADYRPAQRAEAKMKKGTDDDGLANLALTENPDILKGLVERRRTGELPEDLVIAGFAAETGDATHSPLDHARAKLARKGCDLLMCNAVGEGVVFGQQDSSGWILVPGDRPGAEDVTEVATSSKLVVAAHILDALEGLL